MVDKALHMGNYYKHKHESKENVSLEKKKQRQVPEGSNILL